MRRSEGIASAAVQGDAVLLDTRQGKYYTLNATGAAVWDLLSEPRSVDEIQAALLERFEVEPETLRSDLHDLLEDMREHGLVEDSG